MKIASYSCLCMLYIFQRPKDRKAFNVSKNQRVSWTQAQMEAKMFAMIPIAKRLTVFERTLNLSRFDRIAF